MCFFSSFFGGVGWGCVFSFSVVKVFIIITINTHLFMHFYIYCCVSLSKWMNCTLFALTEHKEKYKVCIYADVVCLIEVWSCRGYIYNNVGSIQHKCTAS